MEATTARPSPLLALTLTAAAGLCVLSLFLVWHERIVVGPPPRYVVVRAMVRGIDVDVWLAVVAAICVLMAVRFVRRFPGFFTKWAMTAVGFLTALGVFTDYLDTQGYAASLNVSAVNGPGFFVALAAAALVVTAVVITWRTADPL